MKYPLTTRGSLAAIGATYLLLGPAQSRADLVAAIIGSTAIALIFLSFIICIVSFLRTRRSFSTSIFTSNDNTQSGITERLVLKTSPIQLPPLFESRIQIIFKHEGAFPKEHVLVGKNRSERTLVEDITFPHRGEWEISGIQVGLGDIFGLTRLSFLSKSLTPFIRVKPGQQYSKHIPVISSSERAGDAVEQHLVRTGDPYDLKQYHPADGVKRIIWKLFAKSGDLYSRLEEFAMTPEGKVAAFIIPMKTDDALCNWTLGYVREMESLGLDLIVGAAGMSTTGSELASSYQSTEDLLIKNTWATSWGTKLTPAELKDSLIRDIEKVITRASTSDSTLSRVLLFVSGESVADKNHLQALVELGNFLETQKIAPIFCCQENKLVGKVEPKLAKLVDKLIFEADPSVSTADTEGNFSQFLKVCANSQWHVII